MMSALELPVEGTWISHNSSSSSSSSSTSWRDVNPIQSNGPHGKFANEEEMANVVLLIAMTTVLTLVLVLLVLKSVAQLNW
jgi:hypothetical protein